MLHVRVPGISAPVARFGYGSAPTTLVTVVVVFALEVITIVSRRTQRVTVTPVVALTSKFLRHPSFPPGQSPWPGTVTT